MYPRQIAMYLAKDGLAVVSTQMVVPVTVSSGGATYPLDAEERLRRAFARLTYLDAVALATEAGNARCSNMVVLGALSPALSLGSEAWDEAIRRSVKPALVAVNLRAFENGARTARGA